MSSLVQLDDSWHPSKGHSKPSDHLKSVLFFVFVMVLDSQGTQAMLTPLAETLWSQGSRVVGPL